MSVRTRGPAHFDFRWTVKFDFFRPRDFWIVGKHTSEVQPAARLKKFLASREIPTSFCKEFAERIPQKQALQAQALIIYRELAIQVAELISAPGKSVGK